MTVQLPTITAQQVADWAAPRFADWSAASGTRLYGVTLRDPAALAESAADAARLSFLGAAADAGGLLGSRAALELGDFDAAILASRRHLGGRPALVVLACTDDGVAVTVVHADDAATDAPLTAVAPDAVVLGTLWRVAGLHR